MSGSLQLSAAGLVVEIEPSFGARITGIIDETERNWLFSTGRAVPPPSSAIAFAEGPRGGWDECLPSIAPEPDPNPTGRDIADHGDFWWRPWRLVRAGVDSAELDTTGVEHPLRVRKTVTLGPARGRLTVGVTVSHSGTTPYRYLYSAHPLWAWPSSARLVLPGGGEVRSGFGADWPRPVTGDWPYLPRADGSVRDLSELRRQGDPENYKSFVRWNGVAEVWFGDPPARLSIRQPVGATPWLGVCVNRDSYPEPASGESWLALEPATAPTDSLRTASATGTARILRPGRSITWTTELWFDSTAEAAA